MPIPDPKIISGQYGSISVDGTEVAECTNWTLNQKVAVHKRATCSSNGYKRAVAGIKDASGTLKGAFSPDDPIDSIIAIGDRVELKLYYSATLFHKLYAIIASLDMECDMDEGNIVEWTANFEQDGDPAA